MTKKITRFAARVRLVRYGNGLSNSKSRIAGK